MTHGVTSEGGESDWGQRAGVDLTRETATMSGLTMIVIGLVLGLAGGWSIRTVLMLVGFGAGWLLANVFDANLLVTGGWLAEKTKERVRRVGHLYRRRRLVWPARCSPGESGGTTDRTWPTIPYGCVLYSRRAACRAAAPASGTRGSQLGHGACQY